MAATSKSRVQSAQIILNYEKMVPSKMVCAIPNMSIFHSFEFDKDKIYARHLSSDEEVAKIYHFKSSIQRRKRTIVCRGSPDLKDEVESCSLVSS
jgi:nitrogenase subunit NifH